MTNKEFKKLKDDLWLAANKLRADSDLKSNDYSPTKKRESFDGGQIKSHFGRALVKTMSDINKNPQHIYAIAHPDDELIRKTIGHIIPQLEKLNIKHYWVKKDD